MDHIINNIQLSQNLMFVKNIKNILSMVRFACMENIKWTINKCLKSTH